ncbi:hypothetical protein V6N11_027829 [Hibiscus sabdariffa]|uniref:BZIP domain-containing protein n=1 Tax=Hibiscus sabdariffa TaxID=183260 RepID=A0ABR2NZH8_9ROSI
MDSLYSLEENLDELLPPTSELRLLTPSELELLQEVMNEGDYKEDEDRNNEEETEGDLEMEKFINKGDYKEDEDETEKEENGTTWSFNGGLENNSNHNVSVDVDAFDVHAVLEKKLHVACQAAAKIMPSVNSGVGANGRPSREILEIEDFDVETETMEYMDPADAQRARRTLSNRESARRSRTRKEAELAQLQTKVVELRLKKAAFVERFTDITQKYEKAAIDNRILKADVKALQALVNDLLDISVLNLSFFVAIWSKFWLQSCSTYQCLIPKLRSSVTGFLPVFLGSQGMPTTSMSPFDGSPSVMSTDAIVPMQDGLNQSLDSAAADTPMTHYHMT